MRPSSNKGAIQEELLRKYFIKLGFFVVRGVPFVYSGLDVTDIDLWLYSRTPISRKVTIVDIKNKRTPQAIERIFWTIGLQKVLGADDAIVATTDRRPEVVEFGKSNNVLVLDGNFISRMKSSSFVEDLDIISEEELYSSIRLYKYQKIDGNWVKQLDDCKSVLAERASFDATIILLESGRDFAHRVMTSGSNASTALRIMYRVISYTLISLDMAISNASFLEATERKDVLRNGLIYGSAGKRGLDEALSFSKKLIIDYAKDGERVFSEIKGNVFESVSKTRVEYLVEFFSRNSVASTLFPAARHFELLAVGRKMPNLPESAETKAILYLLLDFWGIDRADFERAVQASLDVKQSTQPTDTDIAPF